MFGKNRHSSQSAPQAAYTCYEIDRADGLVLYALRYFRDNLSWIVAHQATGGAFICDVGDAAPLRAFLEAQRLTISYIALTHSHADHSGGLKDLLEAPSLIRTPYSVKLMGFAGAALAGLRHKALAEKALCEEDGVFSFWGLDLRILHTPGHTRDSVCFYWPSRKWLFSGDSLFHLGAGLLAEGTAEQQAESLIKLAALPDETTVCYGHDYAAAGAAFIRHLWPERPDVQEHYALVRAAKAASRLTYPYPLRLEKKFNPFMKAARETGALGIARVREAKTRFTATAEETA